MNFYVFTFKYTPKAEVRNFNVSCRTAYYAEKVAVARQHDGQWIRAGYFSSGVKKNERKITLLNTSSEMKEKKTL
jgi:hypothetical protein